MILEKNLSRSEYENLPCSFNRFNKRKTISALNKEKPDFNFIKGKINKNIGAANKTRPAKTSAAAKSTERYDNKKSNDF